MRICLLLAALVGALTVLPGCGACPNSAWSNCCQSWDFYDECDLIEGRRARCCQQSCYTPCDPGVVAGENGDLPLIRVQSAIGKRRVDRPFGEGADFQGAPGAGLDDDFHRHASPFA